MNTELHPVVQECIDNYAKYYAEHHKLGMSIRDDMRYVAEVATRWAHESSEDVFRDAVRWRAFMSERTPQARKELEQHADNLAVSNSR